MNAEAREALRRGERAGARYRLAMPRDPATGRDGFRVGRLAGASLDFKDYRDYRPGDDLRHIDWHAYARSDRLVVKLFRQEVAPHADLVLDGSASMALDPVKAAAALEIAAALAAAAGNAHCTHRAWVADRALRPVGNGGEAPSRWQGIAFDFAGAPDAALRAGAGWRRGGLRVLVGDLLWPGDPLSILRRLSDGAAAVSVVQVLGAGDAEPPEPGHARLDDVETGESLELYLDAAVRARYADALAAHRRAWETACRQAQAAFAVIVATPPNTVSSPAESGFEPPSTVEQALPALAAARIVEAR